MSLEQNGFIRSVNQCIELLRAYGDKITPTLLKQYLGEETRAYMSSNDFLRAVIDAIISGGSDFVSKIEELYELKEQIEEGTSTQKITEIVENKTQEIAQEQVSQEEFIQRLSDFILGTEQFRDFLFAYTKKSIEDSIENLDLNVVVSELVKENADKYAQLLLSKTYQKQIMTEASFLVIQQIEKYCLSKCTSIFDPNKLHPQFTPKQGEVSE